MRTKIIFINRIFEFVMRPLQQMLPNGGKLMYTAGGEAFMLYMKIGALAGLVIAIPLILWQLWLFGLAALVQRETTYWGQLIKAKNIHAD